MRTIQMTINENLVKAVDQAVKKLGTTRSDFTRKALHDALSKLKITHLEQQHRAGYQRLPVRKGEFDLWATEQTWGDE